MPYTRPYPGGFQDYPDTSTPLSAAALNAMDSGIEAASNNFQIASSAPVSPSAGQQWYDTANGYMKEWNGSAWVASHVENQSSAPTNPVTGMLWFDSTDSMLKIWTGSAWRTIVCTSAAAGSGATTGTPIQIGRYTWTNETVVNATAWVNATNSFYNFTPKLSNSRLEIVAELAMAPYYPGGPYAGMACRLVWNNSVVTYQAQTHQVYLSSGVDLYTRTVMSWVGTSGSTSSMQLYTQVGAYGSTNTARLNQAANWESHYTITEWAV